MFFPKILEYSRLWPFLVFPPCQCVYTHMAGRTPALQQNWQSPEKSQNLKEKNTICNEHPVCAALITNFAINKYPVNYVANWRMGHLNCNELHIHIVVLIGYNQLFLHCKLFLLLNYIYIFTFIPSARFLSSQTFDENWSLKDSSVVNP